MKHNKPPKIDSRQFRDLDNELKTMAPHYTPEWGGSDESDSGVVLLKIFAHMVEGIIDRLNHVPQKNFVAFLDMLGIKRLPAQPSRVPVTFKLAKGIEREILIPEKTQVAAEKTEEHEELPFETEKNLLATPSQLIKVVSVDPEKDAIFIPPQDFIEGEKQKQVRYKIISSAQANAKKIQLDHNTDLKDGTFLKIGTGEKIDYMEVSGKPGMIVNLKDRLKFTHPSFSPVEKITKFNLFEGKNMQEHILYIGHKDFFNVKSTAKFTLLITLHEIIQEGVFPLQLLWEYWGEVEGEEGEDWQKLIEHDNTLGFNKDGKILLFKMTNGEIKEKEINGIKSRWIRCKLNETLPVNTHRKLPEIDKITLFVNSYGEDLLPDLAFNNDVPLDITETFNPFGKEPKTFDTFAIASKEIFSKKGAKIEINATLATRGILASPTAILFYDTVIVPAPPGPPVCTNQEKIMIFARGTGGRLIELGISTDGTGEFWEDLGFPEDSEIAPECTPSAITNFSGQMIEVESVSSVINKHKNFISVFVRDKNNHLVEIFYNGNQWQWKDQGTPNGININSDPSAVYKEISAITKYETISVFVTGSDGSLYEFNRSPDNMGGSWFDHGKPRPDNVSIILSPFAQGYVIPFSADSEKKEIRIKIFCIGDNGQLFELDSKAGESKYDRWINYGAPNSIKLNSKPLAIIYPLFDATVEYDVYYAKVFARGDDGNLWKYNTKERITTWINLGKPSGEVSIVSPPHGYLIAPYCEDDDYEGKHIFIRGSDNNLWEILTINRNGDYVNEWRSHRSPSNSKLMFSPFVILDTKNKAHIFSTSSQFSIIERRINLDNSTKTWNEYQDINETTLTPALSWEYWNKNGWVVLKEIKDNTNNFLKSGSVVFNLPEDIEETEIAGQGNYWIRARIVGGDFGKETFSFSQKLIFLADNEIVNKELVPTKKSIRPPIITNLTIGYSLETPKYPQQCMTYNNLEYLDQSEICKTKEKFFKVFVELENTKPTFYMGFSKALKGGPINIFFVTKELKEDLKPKMEWEYSIENDWNKLKGHLDKTEGLIKSEIFELTGPLDFFHSLKFGESCFWLKGSLIEGKYEVFPLLDGIYPNTIWTFQAETIKEENLGSSDGRPNQIFSFLKFPVLAGEEIRVHEFVTNEEKQSIKEIIEKNKDIEKELEPVFEQKDEKGEVIENWVLWSEVPDFFNSKEKDRHYTLDRATGQIVFGDGKNGMIPPAGDNNIKAFSYQTGGGVQGNVRAGEIKSIKSAVSGVDNVLNPVDADGGAEAATLDQMLEIGPATISHRNRAVTIEDFEWLGKKASRKVAKVKCLPNTSNKKSAFNEHVWEIGWITVIIVPDEKTPKPTPSLELKRKVLQYLEDYCANILASAHHIRVDGPTYVEINVSADVFVTSIDVISVVEREVRKELDDFFHPLTGGPEEKGWDFGRDVNISDIYALLEDIKGIDHVENVKLAYDRPSGLESTFEDYLFSWDEIPGKHNARFKDFLVKNFNIEWVKTANIKKIDDGNLSLINWDEISGKGSSDLKEFLLQNFDIKWAKTANIQKIDENRIIISNGKNCLSLTLIKLNTKTKLKVIVDDRVIDEFIVKKENDKISLNSTTISGTIKISDGYNSLFLKLNFEKTIASLMINGVKANEFTVKIDNGRLNVYNKDFLSIRPDFLVANGKHILNIQLKKGREQYEPS